MRSRFVLAVLWSALVGCHPDWSLHNRDAGPDGGELAGPDDEGMDGSLALEDAAQPALAGEGGAGQAGQDAQSGASSGSDAGASAGSDAASGDAKTGDAQPPGADAGCGAGHVVKDGTCQDVDECFEGTHECHMTATCKNTEGGYDCTCSVGYSGGTSGGFACVPRVVVGAGFTCALQSDGKVKCWGSNIHGELGDGSQISRLTPVFVKALDHVVAIAAHDSTSACALRDDGTVLCWGDNTSGQLGDGMATPRSEPKPISTLANVVGVSVNNNLACAVIKGGGLKCWGKRGASANDSAVMLAPTPLQGMPSVASVEVGLNGAGCATTQVGAVWCWGASPGSAPAVVPNVKDVLRVSLGLGTCAMRANETISCWGADPSKPYQNSNVVSVSLSLELGYVVLKDGSVHAWNGLPTSLTSEYAYTTEPMDAVVVAGGGAGAPSACAVVRDGTVRCWGINSDGQLGDGTTMGTSPDAATKVWAIKTVSDLRLWQ